MRNWALKQWHRFTLGRTARIAIASYAASPSSISNLAMNLRDAVREWKPIGVVEVSVDQRRAMDLAPDQIRIVIEHNGG